MAQACVAPALTSVKVPVGAAVCPNESSPQHANVPSVLIPQVNAIAAACRTLPLPPALTWVNVPAGGVDSPLVLSPQHAPVPSVLIPHVWMRPALTCVNARAGGVDWRAEL